MAYDEMLSARTADVLIGQNVRFTEKKMFGGVAFMVRKKMCVGVLNQDLMVRIDPEIHDTELIRKGARDMDFTGRPMRGYLFVGPEGTRTSAQLRRWIVLALDYNPRARASRSRTQKKQSAKGRRS